jgi:hypothetical protein
VSSIYMTVFMGSVPIGALIAGSTSALVGTPGSVAFGGAVVLVAALVAALNGLGRRSQLATAPALPVTGTVPPRPGGDD